MNNKIIILLALTLAPVLVPETTIARDGFGTGLGIGLGSGLILSAGLSRRNYDSDSDYIAALEDENAELRAELRACRRR